MSFDVGGFVANLNQVSTEIHAASAKAAEDVAQYILAQAMQEVPHETGDLQSSGRVSTDPETGRAAVSFDTPYAVVQHENMTFHHDAGRKAKYLEDPFNRAVTSGVAERIYRDRLGDAFGGIG